MDTLRRAGRSVSRANASSPVACRYFQDGDEEPERGVGAGPPFPAAGPGEAPVEVLGEGAEDLLRVLVAAGHQAEAGERDHRVAAALVRSRDSRRSRRAGRAPGAPGSCPPRAPDSGRSRPAPELLVDRLDDLLPPLALLLEQGEGVAARRILGRDDDPEPVAGGELAGRRRPASRDPPGTRRPRRRSPSYSKRYHHWGLGAELRPRHLARKTLGHLRIGAEAQHAVRERRLLGDPGVGGGQGVAVAGGEERPQRQDEGRRAPPPPRRARGWCSRRPRRPRSCAAARRRPRSRRWGTGPCGTRSGARSPGAPRRRGTGCSPARSSRPPRGGSRPIAKAGRCALGGGCVAATSRP